MRKKLFNERYHQIEPKLFKVFDIEISSRYGKIGEIVELLEFCRDCALEGVEDCIARVDYDTKNCIATIDFHKEWTSGEDYKIIKEIATNRLTQFAWEDGEVLGKVYTEMEEIMGEGN
jgi:hypothetical protein